MVRDWPQLDALALELTQSWLAYNNNSRAALARHLGMARSSVSQALDGRYPGDTKHLRALIIEKLAHAVRCPHLGSDLAPSDCRAARERPLSAASGSRSDVKHWQACQCCRNNPQRKPTEEVSR